MSFTAEVKDELARLMPSRRCCRLAELSALLHVEGSLHLLGPFRLALHTESENAAVARKIFQLLKGLFAITPELRVEKAPRLKGHNCYHLYLSHEGLLQALNELGLVDDSCHPVLGIPARITRRRCCGIAYLRGAFLGGGYVSGPGQPAHLEINVHHSEMAEQLRRLLERYAISTQVVNRKSLSTVYAKSRREQSDFLALVGAHQAVLELQSGAVLCELRESVNRRVNSETANLEKAVEAAQRQLRAIDVIERNIGLERLPDSLRAVAAARIEFPEATLSELGGCMQPPLSKSAVYHRLRRINRLAASLQEARKP